MKENRAIRITRWVLSVILVIVGLSTTWAWGEVARLAEPAPAVEELQATTLYAAWQPDDADQTRLFRSTDGGVTWLPMALPEGAAVVAWADDGRERLAVALDDGSLLRSNDRGDSWTVVAESLPILSLAWSSDGRLYMGTDGQGIYRLEDGGTLTDITVDQGELASAPVRQLAAVDGRLFAATHSVLFYTDDENGTSERGASAHSLANWNQSSPVSEGIAVLVAIDREQVYIGTETAGVYRSVDAGQSWEPAMEGLGLAAGQMVKITALRADLQEPGVLYATVNHVLGGTQVHTSAAGTFVTLDGGASWQPLDGPAFPEAEHATGLVIMPGQPLYAQAMTAGGLQSYKPDVAGALVALKSADPWARATAARMLGLARSPEAGEALLATLNDPEPAVSLAAAKALGQISDPSTISGLLVAMEHPTGQVRLSAAQALGMMRVEAAVEPLRAMLLNGEGLEITVAGEALSRIGSPSATDALLTALADPEPSARWHAALAALETMGEPAVQPLVEMLDSRDANARYNATEALGWIGSPSATHALVRVLDKDEKATVRMKAAWALGEIGDPTARAALERARSRDRVTAVQAEASMALIRLPDQPSTVARLPMNWAPTLNRLQPLRWLVLMLSLAGAAWLAVGQGRPSLVPVLRRVSR